MYLPCLKYLTQFKGCRYKKKKKHLGLSRQGFCLFVVLQLNYIYLVNYSVDQARVQRDVRKFQICLCCPYSKLKYIYIWQDFPMIDWAINTGEIVTEAHKKLPWERREPSSRTNQPLIFSKSLNSLESLIFWDLEHFRHTWNPGLMPGRVGAKGESLL